MPVRIYINFPRSLAIVVLATVFIAVLHTVSANAKLRPSFQDNQVKGLSVISCETYDRVLDILFPRDVPDPSKTVFKIILRFHPHAQPESQIVIRRGVEKVEVLEYLSLDGNIYRKLNEALAHGSKENAVEMAKSIKVRKRLINVPYSQVKQWHVGLLESIAISTKVFKERSHEFDDMGSETVMLDGAFYDLWYEQRLSKMSFAIYDADVDHHISNDEFKLVQWMNTVRQDIGKMGENRNSH